MTFEFLSLDDGAAGSNGGLLVDTVTIGETPVHLNEGFDNGDGNATVVLPDWSVVDEGTVGGASNWIVNGGQLQQTSNIRSVNTDPANLAKPGTYLLHDSSLNWIDYSVQLSLSSTDNDGIGVMFRYQDSNNYYRFVWNTQDSYRRIEADENGSFRMVAQDSVPYVVGQTYDLDITVRADTLTLSIDGVVIFSQIDSSFRDGGIALYNWANNGGVFDDLSVSIQ